MPKLGKGGKMTKRILQIFFIFCFYIFLAGQAFSAPCYGTKLPSKDQFFVGYESYNLFDRELEDSFGSVRSFQHFLLISYGATDWLSIDLKGGAGKIKQNPLSAAEVDYPSSFAGGYGFRILLIDDFFTDIKIVCGFQHISVHPRSIRLDGVKNEAILDDWQFSLLASKPIYKVTPYIGCKWSRVDYIHRVGDNRKRRMSDRTESIGLILGIDIPFFMESRLNLEGHYFDEEAVAASIFYEF